MNSSLLMSSAVAGRDTKAVRVDHVSKFFGTGDSSTVALDQISFELPYGELVLLVGPSGCGKTTLISVIAGLLDPSIGRVEVLGSDLTAMRASRRVHFRGQNIGFVFQQYNLLPSLTAAENASVPLLIAGWSRQAAIDKASRLLEMLGLGQRLKSYPAQLSGGQQQRVAIARALVHDPRLLVCDEPTAALDAASGKTVMGLIREVAVSPNRAVIVVTHDSRVYGFGDRMIEMSDGRIDQIRARVDGDSWESSSH